MQCAANDGNIHTSRHTVDLKIRDADGLSG